MYIHVEFHGVYSLEYLCTYIQCQCEDILEIKDGGKALPYEPYQG
jgi:DNA-binding Xre family transcriptional regulator